MYEWWSPPNRGVKLLAELLFYDHGNNPFMPVESSGAAYRFGHSQVRASYDRSDVVVGAPPLTAAQLGPGKVDLPTAANEQLKSATPLTRSPTCVASRRGRRSCRRRRRATSRWPTS